MSFISITERLLSKIEKRLNQLFPITSENDCINTAIRKILFAPGKRIRPMLLLLIAADLGYTFLENLLDFACSIEIIHTASLILDDMPCMDNSRIRRGYPAMHLQFGEQIAMLSTVVLISKSFDIISNIRNISDSIKNKIISKLSYTIGSLVQGQFQDLTKENKKENIDSILTINQLKTSSLFFLSMQIVSIVVNLSSNISDQLYQFSFNFGQAFQLLDDLTERVFNTSKDYHKRTEETTLLHLIGIEKTKRTLHNYLNQAQQHLLLANCNNLLTQHFIQKLFDNLLSFNTSNAFYI